MPESLFEKVAGLRPATLLKKETLAQCFPVKFCEISKYTFLHRTPLVAASEELTSHRWTSDGTNLFCEILADLVNNFMDTL